MSNATAVNSQITDAVTQTNVKVIAESPDMAAYPLFESLEQLPLPVPPATSDSAPMLSQSELASVIESLDTAADGGSPFTGSE